MSANASLTRRLYYSSGSSFNYNALIIALVIVAFIKICIIGALIHRRNKKRAQAKAVPEISQLEPVQRTEPYQTPEIRV